MKIRVILQARTTSSRLPGKVLLDLAGFPVVILAALRASNQRHNLVVVTSTDPTDDGLVVALEKYNLSYYRGDLNDVLKRYIEATEDLSDSDLIVRLTADNVFPDGLFISKLLEEYKKQDINYLTTLSIDSKLPYGLTAEIFTVKKLREAHENALTVHEREHVTPYILNNSNKKGIYNSCDKLFTNYCFQNYNCTLDTFNDYIKLQRIFSNIKKPVDISYEELCTRLLTIKNKDFRRITKPYITLGTAQIGIKYGIANKQNLASEEKAINIIQKAISEGIFTFDTARSYGFSEMRIGKALTNNYKEIARVITKLKLDENELDSCNQEKINAMVDASVFRSCVEMNTNRLDTLLLHNINHLTMNDGLIWARLKELKNSGYIKKLGVSIYHPKDAIIALQNENVEHIQLPLNILDHRWQNFSFLEALKRRKEVEIFVRSALLQGLLTLSYQEWPGIVSSKWAQDITTILMSYVKKFNRESIVDLCIAYVRAIPWVDSIIIGIDSLEQLNENLYLYNNPILNKDEMKEIQFKLSDIPEFLLNPTNWSVA